MKWSKRGGEESPGQDKECSRKHCAPPHPPEASSWLWKEEMKVSPPLSPSTTIQAVSSHTGIIILCLEEVAMARDR